MPIAGEEEENHTQEQEFLDAAVEGRPAHYCFLHRCSRDYCSRDVVKDRPLMRQREVHQYRPEAVHSWGYKLLYHS